jgi:septation ring formation regulator EzrA
MSQIDATEARLNTHEILCAERYKGIETRMDNIEQRMDSISQDVKELKEATAKSTSEIKNMLTNAKDEKFKVMITATATIIVSLLAMLGYVITHLK